MLLFTLSISAQANPLEVFIIFNDSNVRCKIMCKEINRMQNLASNSKHFYATDNVAFNAL